MDIQHPAMLMEKQFGAKNYDPLPVILTKGQGCYLWDSEGKRYLDFMSAYSAVSFGHSHPYLVEALVNQAQTLSVTSRAYFTDKLGPFVSELCKMTGQDRALPMNSGAEAVETALKAARKWGYKVKGIPEGQAEIIVCARNFHGRTITIIGMSTEAQYRDGFGPFPEGFKIIPFADTAALEQAITPNTAAFLVEPIQGEGGIIVPPKGYLSRAAEICRRHQVLLIADEVQTGMARTGKFLACEHEGVKPDGLIMGKALGGGLLPVSLFLAREEVMNVFQPGDHGSTFGGNPLACAVGLASLQLLQRENLVERSALMGSYLLSQLKTLRSPLIKDIRGIGLFAGIEIDTQKADTRQLCVDLIDQGLLSKDTHGTVIRLAPPLTISKSQIDDGIRILQKVLAR